MAAILLSSKPYSLPLLLLRQNPNPNPNPRLSTIAVPSLSLKPSLHRRRHSATVSASLIPSLPPPMSPFQSTVIRIAAAALSFLRSLIQSTSSRRVQAALLLSPIIYEMMLLKRHENPELPWHRWPLRAVALLCDPFLTLSRRAIPPLFGSSDLSERLGIQLLSTLHLILIYAWCP